VDFDDLRNKMVDHQLLLRGIKDERVLEAMRKVPRHAFLPENVEQFAYDDGPVSIGEGPTMFSYKRDKNATANFLNDNTVIYFF